jgi:hypothetical protein
VLQRVPRHVQASRREDVATMAADPEARLEPPERVRGSGAPLHSSGAAASRPGGAHRARAPGALRFRALDAGTLEGLAAWLDLWHASPGREVMAHPEYAKLFARPCDRAVALACDGERGAILFPLLLRPLAVEPWARPGERRWDAVTPYGYGGPLAWNVTPREVAAFWSAYAAWCGGERIVSTFARLSPFPSQLAPMPAPIEVRGSCIVRSLGPDPAAVWRDYAHNARTNVRAAERAGLDVEVDTTGARLDAFLAVYAHTMCRRGAIAWYHFPRSFFETLLARLPGHSVFFHTVRGRDVLSSELLLCSDDNVYALLGGTVREAFPLRPNDLLRHRTVQWAIAHGKKAYVLGGGYEEGDGVFRHKRILAPRGAVPFRVAIMTHDGRAYDELVHDRRAFAEARPERWAPRPGFFPMYRA